MHPQNMPAVEDISSSVLQETITTAVQRVFRTMLDIESEFLGEGLDPATDPAAADSGPQIIGTVGFIGKMNGVIYITFPQALAQSIACKLLGMTLADILEMGVETVNDAIGEMTNMTVGAFKNSLSDKGYPCRLTIPSILQGSNFHVEPFESSARRTYRFKLDGHCFAADLLFKEDE